VTGRRPTSSSSAAAGSRSASAVTCGDVAATRPARRPGPRNWLPAMAGYGAARVIQHRNGPNPRPGPARSAETPARVAQVLHAVLAQNRSRSGRPTGQPAARSSPPTAKPDRHGRPRATDGPVHHRAEVVAVTLHRPLHAVPVATIRPGSAGGRIGSVSPAQYARHRVSRRVLPGGVDQRDHDVCRA
jgi:hypothetical protein